jgi:hypothetical protein
MKHTLLLGVFSVIYSATEAPVSSTLEPSVVSRPPTLERREARPAAPCAVPEPRVAACEAKPRAST